MVDKNYISEISNVEKGLKGINAEIAKMEAGLKRVSGLAGVSLGTVKSILSSNIGQGNSLGLGTSGAAFGGAAAGGTGGMGRMMPWLYTKTGTKAVMGGQIALGLMGGGYAALPEAQFTISRAAGYYTAAQRGFGTTRAGLAAATFGALRGGITGMGDDVAASNMLTLGYNYNPGGASYLQAMGEVGGLARAYNMPNAVAAQAIGGLHTGAMGSTFYQAGIRTIDPITGKTRSTEDIARQLYQQAFRGQKGLTAQDIEIAMREGRAGASMRAMGLNETQMNIFTQAFTAFAQGKDFDLKNMSGEGNPMLDLYKQYSSQTALTEKVTEDYISGLSAATAAIVKLNSELENTPGYILKMKSALDFFGGSNVGAGVAGVVGSIGGAIATGLTYKGLTSVLGKGGPSVISPAVKNAMKGNLLGNITKSFGLKTIGKIGLRAVPYVGTALLGYDILKGMFGTPANAAQTSQPGNENIPVIKGNQTETSWAKSLLTKLGAPATDQNISAMTTWMKLEGGGGGKATGIGKNSAMYNPLNTTLETSGATGSINDVGVKKYESWDAGMEATLATLTGKNAAQRGYTDIVEAMKSGKSTEEILKTINNSAWVTGKTGGDPYNFYGNKDKSTGGDKTVNITLKIDKASDAEAIAFAKRVKSLLEKDLSISATGSK